MKVILNRIEPRRSIIIQTTFWSRAKFCSRQNNPT